MCWVNLSPRGPESHSSFQILLSLSDSLFPPQSLQALIQREGETEFAEPFCLSRREENSLLKRKCTTATHSYKSPATMEYNHTE